MRRTALVPCLVPFLALLPLPAAADCSPGETVFSCQIGAKALEICTETDILIYRFGPEAAPEMLIAEPLESVSFTPWPGVSSDIWETVAFFNEGYTYEVWTSVARDPEDTMGLQGGVRVLQGDEMVAELRCDQGTPSQSLDVIWTLKESVGMCWDFGNQSWQYTCDNG